MSLLGNLTVGILGNMGGLSSTFTQAQNQVQQFGQQMQNIGSNLSSAGSAITQTFGPAFAALGGILGVSAKKAMDFEQQMSSVKSVMAPEEVTKFGKSLEALAIQMGAETKYSSLEAAQGIEELIKAGVDLKDIIDGGLKGALSLAVAGELDLASASEIASTALNAFKADNLSVARAADLLAGAANASATSVSEMKFGLSMVSAVASGVGLTLEDTTTALASFAQNGLKGSDAGTSLKTMLLRLSPTTKEAAMLFDQLGLSAHNTAAGYKFLVDRGITPAGRSVEDIEAGLRKLTVQEMGASASKAELKKRYEENAMASGLMSSAFYDETGSLKSMAEIAELLKTSMANLNDEQRQTYMNAMFGTDAIRAANILFKEGADGINSMAEAMNKITAADVAATKLDNVKGRIEILKGTIETAAISIGNSFLPVIDQVVGAIQKLTDWFNNLSPSTVELMAKVGLAATAITGLATAFGVILMVVGGVISSVGTIMTAFAGLSGAIAGAGGVIGILTGPMGLAVAAIVGMGAALIALWKNSETFRVSVSGIFNKVRDVAVQVFTAVSSFIQEKLSAIKSFWDENGAQFLQAVEKVFNGIMAVVDFVMPAVLFLVDMVWTAIKQIIDGALNVIMGLMKVFSGLFTGDFSKMWEGIKQIFFGAIDVIIGWMTVTFVGGLRTLLTNLGKGALNIIQNMATGIVNVFKSFVTTGQNLAKGFVNNVTGFFRDLVDAVITLFNLFKARGASTFEAFKGVVMSIFNSIKSGLMSIWNGLISFLTNGATMIKNGISTAFNAMLNSIKSIWGTVKTTIENLWNGVVTFFKNIDLRQIGKDIIQGLVNGIGSMASAVWEKAKEIANGVSDTIKKVLGIASPSKVMTKHGEWTSQGFADGIEKKKGTVKKASSNTAKVASKAFKEALESANYRFKIGEVDAVAHIKSLEKVRDNYAKTPEQVRKVNLAILDIEKKHAKEIEELQRQKFDSSKGWIDKKKQMNEMSLTEELRAWERVQQQYKAGSKEREEAEQNVYRVKKEIHDKLTTLNDEYVGKMQEVNQKLIEGEKALNDEYTKAYDDKVRSLYSFAGIFDEIKQKADITGRQLIDNLRGQVSTFAEWAANIKALAERGIDGGLLAELRNMGPQAAAEIAALNGLTDSQLQEYAELWRQKNEMAREQATLELEGLKLDTQKKIEELHVNSASQLEKLRIEWDLKIKQIRSGTTGEFNAMKASMSDIGKESITGMINGLSSMEGALLAKARSIADAVAATMRSALQIKSPSRVMMQIGNFVGEGLAIGLEDMVDRVNASASKLAYATIPNVPNMNIPGINNRGNGSTSGQGPLTAGGITQNITINSPSPLSPAESARQYKQASRQLAMEWG